MYVLGTPFAPFPDVALCGLKRPSLRSDVRDRSLASYITQIAFYTEFFVHIWAGNVEY